jgi:hypothetical protein
VDGKEPAVPAYDIGLLKVDGTVPVKFKIAGSSELRKLDSGYRVAFLGFPMENLAGNGVDPHNPGGRYAVRHHHFDDGLLDFQSTLRKIIIVSP